MLRQMHLGLIASFLMVFALSGCKEIDEDELTRKFVNEGLAYRQQIELFRDGSVAHTVFQSSGRSVSTREAHWTLEGSEGVQHIVVSEFNVVVTFKDFAVHRAKGVTYEPMEMTVRRGFLGTYRLTLIADRAITFTSVN